MQKSKKSKTKTNTISNEPVVSNEEISKTSIDSVKEGGSLESYEVEYGDSKGTLTNSKHMRQDSQDSDLSTHVVKISDEDNKMHSTISVTNTRTRWKHQNADIAIVITSHKNYMKKTLHHILPYVKKENVYVIVNEYNTSYTEDNVHYIGVPYNAFEYSAFIESHNIPHDWLFVMHDTCIPGENFTKFMRYFNTNADVTTVENHMNNLGMYKRSFVLTMQKRFQSFQRISRQVAVQYEGFLSKNIGTCSFYQPGGVEFYGTSSKYSKVERSVEYFPSLDLYKYKANYGQSDVFINEP